MLKLAIFLCTTLLSAQASDPTRLDEALLLIANLVLSPHMTNYPDDMSSVFKTGMNKNCPSGRRLKCKKIGKKELALAAPSKDMVCSPLAALVPLAKLLIGASGDCEEQLQDAVGANSAADVKSRFRPLLKYLKSLNGMTVTVLNRIYMSSNHERHSLFTNYVKDVFKSSVKMEDMGHPAHVAKKVNAWVGKRTKKAIPEFVKSADIPSLEGSLMIFNTVYLSAQWKHAFFTVIDSHKNHMMTRGGRYKYIDSDYFNCQIVEIPLTIDKASFTIFLPKSKGDFSTLLDKLKNNPDQIQTSLNRMTKTYLQLTIPKFSTAADIDLTKEYQKLRLTRIFDNKTSFLTGIIKGNQNLYVTRAVQKMVIKVNEHGVGSHYEEKSAAPTLEMAKLSEVINVKKFTAEVPFLYIITVNKEIIVAGVYYPK